jgi:hypothetical protein
MQLKNLQKPVRYDVWLASFNWCPVASVQKDLVSLLDVEVPPVQLVCALSSRTRGAEFDLLSPQSNAGAESSGWPAQAQ